MKINFKTQMLALLLFMIGSSAAMAQSTGYMGGGWYLYCYTGSSIGTVTVGNGPAWPTTQYATSCYYVPLGGGGGYTGNGGSGNTGNTGGGTGGSGTTGGSSTGSGSCFASNCTAQIDKPCEQITSEDVIAAINPTNTGFTYSVAVSSSYGTSDWAVQWNSNSGSWDAGQVTTCSGGGGGAYIP